MQNPRIVGHIISVQGFRVKVELLSESRSAVRATLDGVHVAVAINSYLTFSIGAGKTVVGVITDLEAKETYDPASGDELTLELVKPRRTASVQLLGTIQSQDNRWEFTPGITVLPTLDTAGEIGTPELLKALFEEPPKHNKPDGFNGKDFDCDLKLGWPTGQKGSHVRASYNDLFSRPLAVVGNTGSGKSFTVTSLIQKAMSALKKTEKEDEPHIIILDINGEYSPAFCDNFYKKQIWEKKPDHIYLNCEEFSVPIWFFNAEEVCAWLSASEQTQEPVLKDWWAIAKGAQNNKSFSPIASLQRALNSIENLNLELSSLKKKSSGSYCDAIADNCGSAGIDTTKLKSLFELHRQVGQYNTEIVENQTAISDEIAILREKIQEKISRSVGSMDQEARTADSPLFISRAVLIDPEMVNRAVSRDDTLRIENHLTTLKLRLKTRLDDRRWQAFLNYETLKINSLEDWLKCFGLGMLNGPKVSVIDLSMLSHEVLPYACAVIGRILLETRENLRAVFRYQHPWVIVLEEAHNYARPARNDDARGQTRSRLAFEQIAKEGRKFGLSLIVASQRPSEISPTIISQCANFISHRLQNPDDIDHFRRIIPLQARRLLDQVTILASGEAIVFGSAFHIPARVQFDRPHPLPLSQTAAPYYEWSKEGNAFPLEDVLTAWGLKKSHERKVE